MTTLRLATNSNDHDLGNPAAMFTLIEYGDFECPHCRIVYPLIKKLLKEKGNDLYFVFRNFPLREIHHHAYFSAIAAEAAGKQAKYWEMHDLIFENQENLSTGLLLDMAKDIGLDITQFANDLKSNEIELKIEEDFETGLCYGVNRTPTFFLNGLPVLTFPEACGSPLHQAQLESAVWPDRQNKLSIRSLLFLGCFALFLTARF